ncbi:MAG: hypothetical protein AAB649_01295, partial [Patescibacteria group bacterium]
MLWLRGGGQQVAHPTCYLSKQLNIADSFIGGNLFSNNSNSDSESIAAELKIKSVVVPFMMAE